MFNGESVIEKEIEKDLIDLFNELVVDYRISTESISRSGNYTHIDSLLAMVKTSELFVNDVRIAIGDKPKKIKHKNEIEKKIVKNYKTLGFDYVSVFKEFFEEKGYDSNRKFITQFVIIKVIGEHFKEMFGGDEE